MIWNTPVFSLGSSVALFNQTKWLQPSRTAGQGEANCFVPTQNSARPGRCRLVLGTKLKAHFANEIQMRRGWDDRFLLMT